MTAEIGVMNRLGVALAADSAVTLGGGDGKIYTSVDKLFQLSPIAPVGVMIYGRADICGIPWETVIKTYRSQLGTTLFGSIGEYQENFLMFLKSQKKMFSQSWQKRESLEIVYAIFETIRDRIARKCKDEIDEKVEVDDSVIARISEQVIRNALKNIRENPFFENFSKNSQETVRKNYSKDFALIKKEIFKKLPVKAYDRQCLSTIAIEGVTTILFGKMGKL